MVYPDDFFMYDEIAGQEMPHIPFRLQQNVNYPKPIPYEILYKAFNQDDDQERIKKEALKIVLKNNIQKNPEWMGWNTEISSKTSDLDNANANTNTKSSTKAKPGTTR